MIYTPFNLFLTLQFVIGFFIFFIFYSFYKKAKLKFSIGYNFFQEGAHIFTCLKMPVDITQCRGSIGIFNNRNFVFRAKLSNFIGHKCWDSNHLYFKLHCLMFPMNLVFLVFVIVFSPRLSFHITPINTGTSMLVITAASVFDYLCFKYNLLLLCGDVEINPGPKQNTAKKITICHWNLNSIAAHNFAKLVLLKAYNSVHKFDIICLSKMFLDSNILSDGNNLKIPGYNLVRSDHPSNKKRGGVCIYYKSYMPLRIIDIIYLNECVRLELMVGDKLCDFIALYTSSSQSQDLLEFFKENLELNLESALQKNPFLVVLLGDFNAKSSNWCKNDITTTEGKAIENISSQFGLHQMISEPTHILESSSSCIDLIFTSQPYLITESGVHPSLHPNSHQQIIFAKFNLEIH